MDIGIVCIDTRGGVQPYLALAVGLLRGGHQVRFIAPKENAGFVGAFGVPFYGLRGDLQDAVHREATGGHATDKGFLRGHLLMIRTVTSMVSQWTSDVYEACRGCDVIVAGFGGMLAAEGVAEKLGVPLVQAHVQPLTPTRHFRGLVKPPGVSNRLSHALARQAFWQPLRRAVNRARKSVLALGPAPFFGSAGRAEKSNVPMLYGYSPSLLPRPEDWPSNVHVTGYWFLDERGDWQAPEDLVTFLDAGPKPVLIGFGSMASSDAAATDELLTSAVRLAGQRAVLVSGWSRPPSAPNEGDVFRIASAPYGWLMRRVAAAVHHGGAGTTGATLAAGIPCVIVPHTADQPFWGDVISSKQLGPKPIPRKRLTAERLAAAIREAVGDDRYSVNAQAIAGRMRLEDGVDAAVRVIEGCAA